MERYLTVIDNKQAKLGVLSGAGGVYSDILNPCAAAKFALSVRFSGAVDKYESN